MNEPPEIVEANTYVAWHDFGKVLRRLRIRQGLSQERLARLLGCDRTYIWRLEHGRNRPSRIFLHLLKNICILTSQDSQMLTDFMKLHEFRCDKLEFKEDDFKQ